MVGYSKLLINEQTRLLRELNELVQGTEQFRTAQTKNGLVRVATGDGMALVFRDNPESPVRCALEISRALRKQTPVPIRMGVHSGPVNEVRDVNNRRNVAGPESTSPSGSWTAGTLGTFCSPNMWRKILSITRAGGRFCTTSGNVKSNTATGLRWSIFTVPKPAIRSCRRKFDGSEKKEPPLQFCSSARLRH